mmetsp:Transcript_33060/g.77320  ORF Transcript_33060/g.77320 Transcript_33060/m.77320 type:complete len:237 (+) Transcript_33060:842-1552(+)
MLSHQHIRAFMNGVLRSLDPLDFILEIVAQSVEGQTFSWPATTEAPGRQALKLLWILDDRDGLKELEADNSLKEDIHFGGTSQPANMPEPLIVQRSVCTSDRCHIPHPWHRVEEKSNSHHPRHHGQEQPSLPTSEDEGDSHYETDKEVAPKDDVLDIVQGTMHGLVPQRHFDVHGCVVDLLSINLLHVLFLVHHAEVLRELRVDWHSKEAVKTSHSLLATQIQLHKNLTCVLTRAR